MIELAASTGSGETKKRQLFHMKVQAVRSRGESRLRPVWFPGVYLWLLPLGGTLLSLRRVQQAAVSQPVAQASSHHGRARPRGTWGSTPKHLVYREGETRSCSRRTHSVPGTVFRSRSQPHSHSIFVKIQRRRNSHCPHFTHEESVAQRGQRTVQDHMARKW